MLYDNVINEFKHVLISSKKQELESEDDMEQKEFSSTLGGLLSSLPQTSNEKDQKVKNMEDHNNLDGKNEFELEAQKRVPAPLIVLFQFVASSQQSEKIQSSSIQLCQCILLNTRHIWIKKTESLLTDKNLMEAALECLLIMLQQENGTLNDIESLN